MTLSGSGRPGSTSVVGLQDGTWVGVRGRNGRVLITNDYGDYATGARFLSVLADDSPAAQSAPIAWLPSEAWASRDTGLAAMTRLWQAAASDCRVDDDGYGEEYVFAFPGGSVRCAVDGTAVRVVDEADDERGYWVDEEWYDDPELVLGAVVGLMLTLAKAADG